MSRPRRTHAICVALSLLAGLCSTACKPDTRGSAGDAPPGTSAAAPQNEAKARLKPVFLTPADGKVWTLFGEQITHKVTGDQTDGAYAVIESVVPPGSGPPPHIHHDEEELFYVAEGEFELRYGDETRRSGVGTIAMLPRNISHGFRNVGTTPGKILTVISPARFEHFFEEVFALPQAERGDMAKVTAIAARYHLEFLPVPPPGKQ